MHFNIEGKNNYQRNFKTELYEDISETLSKRLSQYL